MRRGLHVAVGVVALAATACGSRVENFPDEALAPVDYYVEERVSENDTSPRFTSTTAGDATDNDDTGSPATTAKREANDPAGAAFAHPADGTYTYDVTIEFPAFEDEPASTDRDSFDVTWKTTGGVGNATLESREPYSDDPDDGAYVSSYRLSATALELLKTFDSDDPETSCTMQPAQVMLQLPLKVGAKWRSDSKCNPYGDEVVQRTIADSEVTGTTTETIGSKSVTVFVVKIKQTFSEDYGDEDDFSTTSNATLHVDPSTLLVVRETRSDTDEEIGTVTATRVLKGLTPK